MSKTAAKGMTLKEAKAALAAGRRPAGVCLSANKINPSSGWPKFVAAVNRALPRNPKSLTGRQPPIYAARAASPLWGELASTPDGCSRLVRIVQGREQVGADEIETDLKVLRDMPPKRASRSKCRKPAVIKGGAACDAVMGCYTRPTVGDCWGGPGSAGLKRSKKAKRPCRQGNVKDPVACGKLGDICSFGENRQECWGVPGYLVAGRRAMASGGYDGYDEDEYEEEYEEPRYYRARRGSY